MNMNDTNIKQNASDNQEQQSITKECPFCSEMIQNKAVKCRFCGEFLNNDAKDVIVKNHAQNAMNVDLGLLAFLVPFLGAFISYFIIMSSTLWDRPDQKLMIFTIVTIVISAILVFMDASKLNVNSSEKVKESAVSIFIGCLLLWIVVLPYYSIIRKKVGAKSYFIVSLLGVLLFTGTVLYIQSSIESSKDKARSELMKYYSS